MPVEIIPNNPSISKVRAIITSQWSDNGYRPTTFRAIESYFVDTALDNDSDSFEIAIADPKGHYLELFKRDAEVRCQLFGVGKQGAEFIAAGIGEDIAYDDQGTITITGRDYSALATDSTVPPQQWRMKHGWAIVEQQAAELGFQRLKLAHSGKVHRTLYADGSESYWEFWYRLYRKDKQFLWCEPNGALIAGPLNYGDNPVYFFGKPRKSDPSSVKKNYIPIERLEIHKSTQRRLAEVWVFGQKGEIGFLERVTDPHTNLWVKRSRKVMFDSTITSSKAAIKIGREEIFEGKVGSVEYRITVADQGWMIHQNKIARLNIPEIGLEGDFFVVGSRIQCNESGFVQEVRLRERQYAISRRTPDDPKLAQTKQPQRGSVLTGLAQGIASTANMKEEWGMYFVKAANEFHGPWDYNLFLATLIGICDQESTFTNKREIYTGNPTVQWYPPPQNNPQEAHRHGEDAPRRNYDEWCDLFANAKGNPRNPFGREAGVGPMQLTSAGLKEGADDHFRQGYRNEYQGGRWHPEHNIWQAAKYLRDCLKSVVRDSGRDVDIWMGVSAYNHGPGGASVGDSYSTSVKNKVLHTPGYLASVTAAVKASREAAKAAQDNSTDAWTGDVVHPKGLPTREQALAFFKHFTNPNFVHYTSKALQRQAVVNAAMWGLYNRNVMTYDHSQPDDLKPPPNVPNHTDCSWFSHWCYRSAGIEIGTWTNPQWNSGTKISAAALQPGDLVFYADPNSKHSHVAVYVGFGKVVSMGSQGGPWLVEVKYRSDLAGFRSYI